MKLIGILSSHLPIYEISTLEFLKNFWHYRKVNKELAKFCQNPKSKSENERAILLILLLNLRTKLYQAIILTITVSKEHLILDKRQISRNAEVSKTLYEQLEENRIRKTRYSNWSHSKAKSSWNKFLRNLILIMTQFILSMIMRLIKSSIRWLKTQIWMMIWWKLTW